VIRSAKSIHRSRLKMRLQPTEVVLHYPDRRPKLGALSATIKPCPRQSAGGCADEGC
jgi:hypothetical protein